MGPTRSAPPAALAPCSLGQDGPALGAQAGPAALESVFRKAGYSHRRAAHTTPFNIVFEARV